MLDQFSAAQSQFTLLHEERRRLVNVSLCASLFVYLSEKAVAIIESIVFLLKANLDEMCKLSSPPEKIQISGGLAALEGLNQRIADISGLPVYRPTDCEATARGTAYLLADQPQHWPEQNEGRRYNPEDNPALLERYKKWTTAMLSHIRKE